MNYEPVPTDQLEAIIDHAREALTMLPREAIVASQVFLAGKLLEAQTALTEGGATHGGDLLTPNEQEALRLSGELASLCHRIIGPGPQAANDWSEMAYRIHGVQHMILAQAAARAYPKVYRLLGGTLNTTDAAPTEGGATDG